MRYRVPAIGDGLATISIAQLRGPVPRPLEYSSRTQRVRRASGPVLELAVAASRAGHIFAGPRIAR